jgi:phasin
VAIDPGDRITIPGYPASSGLGEISLLSSNGNGWWASWHVHITRTSPFLCGGLFWDTLALKNLPQGWNDSWRVLVTSVLTRTRSSISGVFRNCADPREVASVMDQSKRTVQKAADTAREGIERGSRAAEKGFQAIERSYSTAFDGMRDMQQKLFEIAQENTRVGLEFVTALTGARSPSDLIQVWTAYSRKQFEMLTRQTKELTELSQGFATDSMQRIQSAARTVSEDEV